MAWKEYTYKNAVEMRKDADAALDKILKSATAYQTGIVELTAFIMESAQEMPDQGLSETAICLAAAVLRLTEQNKKGGFCE